MLGTPVILFVDHVVHDFDVIEENVDFAHDLVKVFSRSVPTCVYRSMNTFFLAFFEKSVQKVNLQ